MVCSGASVRRAERSVSFLVSRRIYSDATRLVMPSAERSAPHSRMIPRRRRMTHDRRVLLMALLAGLPGSLLALGLLWFGDHAPRVQWTCTVLVLGLWWGFAFALQGTVVRPLQTLSNLLAALREEDFSFRARGGRGEDSLGDAMREVNALAETLRQQRLGALEATALLRKVMGEIDVAVFAFDAERRLRLVNRAGQRLLGRPAEQLLGRSAEELGLGEPLGAAEPAEAAG